MEATSSFRALTSAELALETIVDVLDSFPNSGVVALIENRREQRGVAVPMDGPDPGPDRLLDLHGLLMQGCGDDPACRMVLASMRPWAPMILHEDDLAAWRELQARHADRACRLLDWFVFGGGPQAEVLSLAEAAGPVPDWA